jgi:transposase
MGKNFRARMEWPADQIERRPSAALVALRAMKDVATMIRKHFDVAWTQTRKTNGFIEAINGLFQAAKRKARGYTRFHTMKTVLFLIAGKLNFSSINPHAGP